MKPGMSSTINDIRPPSIHHKHSPWPQRYGVLIGVVGLHVLGLAALLTMKLNAPAADAPVLTVQWVPAEKTSPPQPKPEQKPKEPPMKKPLPEAVQKAVPVPQAKPVDAPVIQATAAAPSVAEAPQAPPAPPQAPAPQPVTQQAAAPSTPVDRNLNVIADCIQHPDPTYPAASKTLVEEGTVELRFQVDERGRPLQVQITKGSGHARLDRAARDNILNSWVCPLRQGNKTLGGWLLHAVTFQLSF